VGFVSRYRRWPTALCLVAAVFLSASVAGGATRYDPRLRFRTIATARFDIHFHQGEEDVARRLARFVDEAAREVDRAVGAATGRVQIILVDQHDLSNGWATPLPYNTIEISAAAPTVESSVGNTDDWLRLVFIHEYTHVAHLSRASGWIGALRRGLGRLPLLFPNLYQPLWGIEGIATWRESAATGQGRVVAGDFRQIIARAAADRFEPIDRTNGGNVNWPSGTTPYVYGAYFHQYLADRFGPDTLRALADETGRRLPYLGSRAYKKVFGQSLGELWEDFAKATAADAGQLADAPAATRLTRHGFDVSGPRYAKDGRVFYSAISPHHFPALMELHGSSPPREIAKRYLGNRIAVAGDRLLLDEIDLVRNVGLKSDLYLVNPEDGTRRRVTREARAGDPDISSASVVVCTVQLSDRRALATFQLPDDGSEAVPQILISEPATDYGSPRWAPDAMFIAAERRRTGGGSQIVLIKASDRMLRVLAELPGGRNGAPTWTPDGRRVLFSAAVGREPFRIYSVEIASGVVSRLEGTGSAQSPDVSPDGRSVVYVGYTVEGYDLFSMSLAEARWATIEQSVSAGTPAAAPAGGEATSADRPFSPWRTLLPRFWTPTLESDADEVVVGAATAGLDALARHAYGIEAGWSARTRPDWQIAYAYDRWWPTFFAAVADDTDPWRSGDLRRREADIGLLFRASRVRMSHTMLASFHYARDSFQCGSCEPAVDADRSRGALRLGWDFSSAKSFGYSISAEEGARASMTAETTRTGFGADGNGFAMTAEARGYWRAGPRHAVFALRGAAAASWGDPEAERRFTASGSGPQGTGLDFDEDAIGLLRGFDADDVIGTRAMTANADFRFPLLRIDRGAGTIPLFVRSIHAAVFIDAGSAWEDQARWSDLRLSFGAEASIDAVVGFSLPVTLTAGGAWRRDGSTGDRGFVAFTRIGRAF
jgi:hypothetical protein